MKVEGRNVVVRISVGITLVVVAALLGILFTLPQPSAVERSPLTVDESTLNFGRRWTHEVFEWKVKLLNQSDLTLTIEGVEASCNCTSLLQTSFTVPPRGIIELPLRITPPQEQTAQSSADFSTSMTVFVRGYQRPEQIRLIGAFRTFASLEPDELFFGQCLQEDDSQASRDCILRASCPLAEVYPVDHGELPFHVQVEIASPDRQSYRLIVSPKSNAPIGEFDHRLRLRCILEDTQSESAPVPPLQLRLTGEIIGDVISQPPRFDLGIVRDVSVRMLECRLLSRGNKSFALVEPFEAPDFLGQPTVTNAPAMAAWDLRIPIASLAPGVFRGVLVIPVRYSDGAVSSVRVPITGFHSASTATSLTSTADRPPIPMRDNGHGLK